MDSKISIWINSILALGIVILLPFQEWQGIMWLSIFAVISFIQNTVFTIVSRSRNSGNHKLHRIVAFLSNGIWFINQVWIIKIIWQNLLNNDILFLVTAGFVYVITTANGSSFGMYFWARVVETKDESYRVGAKMKEA